MKRLVLCGQQGPAAFYAEGTPNPSLERAAVARLPRNKAENAHFVRLTFQ